MWIAVFNNMRIDGWGEINLWTKEEIIWFKKDDNRTLEELQNYQNCLEKLKNLQLIQSFIFLFQSQINW